MVRRGLKTTVIATVMAMMLAPSFSAFAQTGKSNTSGSWQVENNAWVFRNAEGQSVKGWVVYNQEWYYLNPEDNAENGKMLFNTKVDGYTLGADGAWQKI